MNYLGGGCKGEVDGRALDVKVPIIAENIDYKIANVVRGAG